MTLRDSPLADLCGALISADESCFGRWCQLMDQRGAAGIDDMVASQVPLHRAVEELRRLCLADAGDAKAARRDLMRMQVEGEIRYEAQTGRQRAAATRDEIRRQTQPAPGAGQGTASPPAARAGLRAPGRPLMPRVVCAACQAPARVQFTAGTRLAEIACPACGTRSLRLPRLAGAPTAAGRTYEHCVMCSKRGLSLRHPPVEWEPKYETAAGPYPAGSPCCWFHEPVPASRARHSDVIQDLAERLGPHDPGLWPEDSWEALSQIARAAPLRCPVCAAAGRSRNPVYAGDSDFSAADACQFEQGAALLAWCWDCGNTVELAAVRPGGPYVAAVTEPAQGMLWEPLHWAVTARTLSPKLGAGEACTYWAGPVHGRRASDIPNTWIGADPGDPQIMRFPSPAAAQAALDSVFGPGSRWALPDGRQRPVRIVAVPEP